MKLVICLTSFFKPYKPRNFNIVIGWLRSANYRPHHDHIVKGLMLPQWQYKLVQPKTICINRENVFCDCYHIRDFALCLALWSIWWFKLYMVHHYAQVPTLGLTSHFLSSRWLPLDGGKWALSLGPMKGFLVAALFFILFNNLIVQACNHFGWEVQWW